ncbi:hemolysin-III channel protein Izh2 [Xylona heveae TC161]|uniref:Hemolysin-III channel protein Izh2 n=1 Tax=Xylona heveae (strain CBS 132557 / TC161) TaxID=1328760 RepID=A0A165A0T9_XYLHT|nr:hemolysin-III channel protein Izh2 [Xylona heveae TC161]KZF19794.1 hemolysin-III channel protein Izh2 [Xylona heveae TC161]
MSTRQRTPAASPSVNGSTKPSTTTATGIEGPKNPSNSTNSASIRDKSFSSHDDQNDNDSSIVDPLLNTAKAVEHQAEKVFHLLRWDDLPHWLRDNHYIVSGYRPPSNSFRKSFASIAAIHNETYNIWSHLVGAALSIIAAAALYHVIAPRYTASATSADIIVFGCFFGGAALCLGMSATYHTISNHSHETASFGNKLDYLGIVFLIAGSFVPCIYYGFYCAPTLQKTYWTMISSIGFGCAVVSVIPKFRTPAWRPFRASMFVAMGLSAVFPVLHGLQLYGFEQINRQMGLSWTVLQGFLYILGAGIYAARVPERFSPGTFDIWGSSHQIFHTLVVLAAVAHLIGLLKAFDYNHSSGINGGRVVCSSL